MLDVGGWADRGGGGKAPQLRNQQHFPADRVGRKQGQPLCLGAELNQTLPMQTLAMGLWCHAKGICLSQQPPAGELIIPYDISWQNDFVRRGVEVWKEEMSEMFLIPDNLFGV